MNTKYTIERNTQILIALMKEHKIKKIVISPGATNICFVASIQQDPYFEIYSCVDERSAAYMACGLSAESGEPVALSCTGATASRNYMSALTEAYYRKLPILAITSTQHTSRIGNNIPQVIDRSTMPKDTVKLSVELKVMRDDDDLWDCNLKVNSALLCLTSKDTGPVHINLVTTYHKDFSVETLPPQRVIKKLYSHNKLPPIDAKKVAVFVGSHTKWSVELTSSVDEFCEKNNGVVICDHTSNYKGKYGIKSSLTLSQATNLEIRDVELLIHIGGVSGAYLNFRPKEVWRVNTDGKIVDTYKTLRYVFEMDERDFFNSYISNRNKIETTYYEEWINIYNTICCNISNLPFSNPWIAQNTIKKIPKNSVLHLGILNTLRSWNFFELDKSISVYSNTGGFGIDGCVSSLIGASLSNSDKLFFGVVGDLAFFYDMNVMGNRHVGNNVRLMVVNNGKGTEFKNYNHAAAQFADYADEFMAAAGHFGNKSSNLIKNYVENLGFKYLSAKNKDEYLNRVDEFVSHDHNGSSIVFEVFTDSLLESDAIEMMNNTIK